MGAYDAAVDAFVNAVNASDEKTRAEELAKAVTEDVVFFGPEREEAFENRDQLGEYLGKIGEMVPPGTKVVRTTPVDEHHGQVRWSLVFRLPDGTDAYRFESFAKAATES